MMRWETIGRCNHSAIEQASLWHDTFADTRVINSAREAGAATEHAATNKFRKLTIAVGQAATYFIILPSGQWRNYGLKGEVDARLQAKFLTWCNYRPKVGVRPLTPKSGGRVRALRPPP